MKPDKRFIRQPKSFWAYVRTISEAVGYTVRGTKQILVPKVCMMASALEKRSLDSSKVIKGKKPTSLGRKLFEYFSCRADILNKYVEPRLMDAKRAKATFKELRKEHRPSCPLPMNKQKGAKKARAFFTGIINMLIEANADGSECDYDPRTLTTVTRDGEALRTLARRVDGAFPSTVNPVAVWEIKEYYYTTTFGSRVADGVYESLLDGMELEELRVNEGIDVKHYLMVDAHYTWWDCGRSYLCRIMDMLHMGYIDEALFGHEVVERMPDIVKEWVKIVRSRESVDRRRGATS